MGAPTCAVFAGWARPWRWQVGLSIRTVFRFYPPLVLYPSHPGAILRDLKPCQLTGRRKTLAVTLRYVASGEEKAGDGGAGAKAGSRKQWPAQDAHHTRHLAGHSCCSGTEGTRDLVRC